MLKQKARAIALGVLAGDLALTALSLPVAYVIRHVVLTSLSPSLFPKPLHPFDRYLFLLVLILPFWTVMLSIAGFYRSHRTLPLAEEIWGATKVAFGGTAVLALVVYGLRLEFVSRWLLVVFAVVNFAFLATEKVALRLLSRWVRARGYNFRTVLLVGTGQKAAQLADFLEAHPHWGFRVMGYLDDDNGGEIRRANRWPCAGKITDLESVLLREVVDEVVFVIEKGKLGAYEEALLVAERHGVRAHVSLDIFPHVLARPVLEELDGIPLLSFTTTPSNPAQLVVKRAIDLAVSLCLFVLTLPIQVLAVIAIKLTSQGPVFFRQVRCGLNGRHFTLLKFRTMDAGAEQRLTEVSHLNEMTGARLQDVAGPAFDVRRAHPAAPVDRRAASAVERDPGRHEPRRTAPAPSRGSLAIPALAAPPPEHEPGADVPLAGLRAQRSGFRPVDGSGSQVHRHLVADARPEDPAEDGPGGAERKGSQIGAVSGELSGISYQSNGDARRLLISRELGRNWSERQPERRVSS